MQNGDFVPKVAFDPFQKWFWLEKLTQFEVEVTQVFESISGLSTSLARKTQKKDLRKHRRGITKESVKNLAKESAKKSRQTSAEKIWCESKKRKV